MCEIFFRYSVKYECQLTEVLFRAQIGGWALAHRAVATRPPDYFLETHRHLFEKHDEQFGAENNKINSNNGNNSNNSNNGSNGNNNDNDDEGLYQSTDILTFHNLVTHDKTGQKQPPGNNSIYSCCICNLQASDYSITNLN